MNWVDVVILGIVGLSVIAGLASGAIKAVFSIVGVVVGFVVASRESGGVAMLLEDRLPAGAAGAVGFLAVFFGIVLVFALGGWLLRKILKGLSLSWMDRLLGGGLGFVRGAAIVGVLALVVEGLGSFAAARESPAYGHALRAGAFLLELVPPETRERLDWEKLRELIPERLGGRSADDVI